MAIIEQCVVRYVYDIDYPSMIEKSMDDHIKRGWFIKSMQEVEHNYLFVVYEREINEEINRKNID